MENVLVVVIMGTMLIITTLPLAWIVTQRVQLAKAQIPINATHALPQMLLQTVILALANVIVSISMQHLLHI